ncbi:hypothetical protein NOGI109294_26975 [Nocardiopsis gilva]
MPITPEGLSPGQRIAWYRVRRGMSQEVLAGLIGRTADWLGKIENDRAPLDRLSVIRSLADVLDVSVLDLIDKRTGRRVASRNDLDVQRLRSALLDYRQLSPLLARVQSDSKPTDLQALRQDIDYVMGAYQASGYGRMLRRLPDLLIRTHAATYEYSGDKQVTAQRLSALANQAVATILTKLGESDLAWISAQRGLKAAEQSGDDAIIGSLFRSVVHSLHSHEQPRASAEMTQQAADFIHVRMDWSSPRMLSIYGTLLLSGVVAAARSGDRTTAKAYFGRSSAGSGSPGKRLQPPVDGVRADKCCGTSRSDRNGARRCGNRSRHRARHRHISFAGRAASAPRIRGRERASPQEPAGRRTDTTAPS